MDEPALLTVPVQVHVIARVRVGFCTMCAHERFVQCASAGSSCSTARGREHVIMRSRALSSCVGACTVEFMYECQYLSTVLASQGFVLMCTSVRHEHKRALCGANPQGRYTVCWYSPTKALYPVLMCSCRSVRSEPARACASVYDTSRKSFVRCKTTKALYSVLVLAPQGFAPRAYVLVR